MKKWIIRIVIACLVAGVSGLALIGNKADSRTDWQNVAAWSNTARLSTMVVQHPTPPPNCPESYIELLVDKPEVKVGERFEMTAIYHNLGQPFVYSVGFNPQGLAVVDPPFDPPCQLCSVFQLRAVSVGRVEIGMCATGEIYCNGWMWSGACSKTPAVVDIDPAQIYLPLVIH